MSRPKHYWYGFSKKMIQRYPVLKNEQSEQAKKFCMAIERAMNETEKMEYGAMRLQAIDEILISKIKTVDGVALEFNFSWRTIQNWINEFINRVGRYAGF